MSYIPDNYDLYVRHEAEQERILSRCPICCKCENRIVDDYAYNLDDDLNHLYCGDCAQEWLKEQMVSVDDLETDFREDL